jgi:hypothetical protein
MFCGMSDLFLIPLVAKMLLGRFLRCFVGNGIPNVGKKETPFSAK